MKKIILLQILSVLLISSCIKDDFEEENYPEKKLKNYVAYMIPYKYGLPDLANKFVWEEIDYNEEGRITKKSFRSNSNFDEESNTLWTEYYKYENGILKEINLKMFGVLQKERHVYKYENQMHVGTEVYGENGLLEKYEYKYKSGITKPYQLHYWWLFFDNQPTIHTYSYDTKDNMIRDSINYANSRYGVLSWKYDNQNNMIEESYYSSEKDKTTIQAIRSYIYGQNGSIQVYVFSTWHTLYFQKYIYQYSSDGEISHIEVFESSNGQYGTYKEKGIIRYEYSYF